MPVRLMTHSSVVSSIVARSSFDSTAGGRHLPHPVMDAFAALVIARERIADGHAPASLAPGAKSYGPGTADAGASALRCRGETSERRPTACVTPMRPVVLRCPGNANQQ